MDPNNARKHFEELTNREQVAAVRRVAGELGVHSAAFASGLSVESIKRLLADQSQLEEQP